MGQRTPLQNARSHVITKCDSSRCYNLQQLKLLDLATAHVNTYLDEDYFYCVMYYNLRRYYSFQNVTVVWAEANYFLKKKFLSAGFKIPEPPKCDSSLGLEAEGRKDIRLPHTSMIASTERNSYFARNARLNAIAGYPGYGAWWPTSNDDKQWIQINLNKWTKFTRLVD